MPVATNPVKNFAPSKNIEVKPDPMKYTWEIDELSCVQGEQRITISFRGDLVASLAHTLRHSPEGKCKMASALKTLSGILFRCGDAMFGKIDPLVTPRLAPVIILPDGTVNEGEPFDPRGDSYEIEDVA